MGRPKAANPREKMLFVRLTPEDHAEFEDAAAYTAATTGVTGLSNWVRLELKKAVARIRRERAAKE